MGNGLKITLEFAKVEVTEILIIEMQAVTRGDGISLPCFLSPLCSLILGCASFSISRAPHSPGWWVRDCRNTCVRIQAQLRASPFLTLLWLNWCGHSCRILSYSHRSIDLKKSFGRLSCLKGRIILPFGLLAKESWSACPESGKSIQSTLPKGYGYFYALRRSALVMLTCFAKPLFWTLCRVFIPC